MQSRLSSLARCRVPPDTPFCLSSSLLLSLFFCISFFTPLFLPYPFFHSFFLVLSWSSLKKCFGLFVFLTFSLFSFFVRSSTLCLCFLYLSVFLHLFPDVSLFLSLCLSLSLSLSLSPMLSPLLPLLSLLPLLRGASVSTLIPQQHIAAP